MTSPPSISGTPEAVSGRRRGRGPELALVDEVAVWLEVNGTPAVTWMCTPEQLEELVVGWLHGEGFIASRDDLTSLRPCPSDLGFWAEVDPARADAVRQAQRTPVLASGCGAVPVHLADPDREPQGPHRGAPPGSDQLRAQFKALFAAGARYNATGGIHAAALSDGDTLLYHAEDIGRHNAVDKVIGAALLRGHALAGRGLLVTGRVSAELAFKGTRAGL
ncbi:MAG: formate dehydrogenase accessory sulfurtransferase FdhD, partial [Synechococcaceae cyanobacterium]|nr:formate dehydrogenase accessory sulfurtransferase FdhD [Synechococcaceae cyanobacterium]